VPLLLSVLLYAHCTLHYFFCRYCSFPVTKICPYFIHHIKSNKAPIQYVTTCSTTIAAQHNASMMNITGLASEYEEESLTSSSHGHSPFDTLRNRFQSVANDIEQEDNSTPSWKGTPSEKDDNDLMGPYFSTTHCAAAFKDKRLARLDKLEKCTVRKNDERLIRNGSLRRKCFNSLPKETLHNDTVVGSIGTHIGGASTNTSSSCKRMKVAYSVQKGGLGSCLKKRTVSAVSAMERVKEKEKTACTSIMRPFKKNVNRVTFAASTKHSNNMAIVRDEEPLRQEEGTRILKQQEALLGKTHTTTRQAKTPRRRRGKWKINSNRNTESVLSAVRARESLYLERETLQEENRCRFMINFHQMRRNEESVALAISLQAINSNADARA
jgi:hypothetical protein